MGPVHQTYADVIFEAASHRLGRQVAAPRVLHAFDDDAKYMLGLSAITSRFVRRGGNSSCATFVDTTPYLHSRWVPLRMFSTLRSAFFLDLGQCM